MSRTPALASLAIGGAALTAAALALLSPSSADACGGFFCNNSQPVDQTGEHIIFAVDYEAGTTEAHVLINYAGPAEEFAWIVPTPSFPEVGVSSATVFSRLENVLAPRFIVNWSEIGTCRRDHGRTADSAESADASPSAGAADDFDGVTVISRQDVGPYDVVILQATDSAVLLDWLEANAYDIPRDVLPFIEPYVVMGGDIHFVAFKLLSDRNTGDLQPVTLKYRGTTPSIPIQLTAVATVPDLGVTTTVLGRHRAVPDNYLHVDINYARLDWLANGANYDALVTAAMDEAGGQGFRTEFAGSTEITRGLFYREGQYNYEAIASASLFELVWRLQEQGFFGEPQILELFEQFIPVPAGVDPQNFYNCIECYADNIAAEDFDSVAFADALWMTIVEPLQHAQELFDAAPYVTRLYTTLSAEEMTLDPRFVFNEEMDDFSNLHVVEAIVDCGDGGEYFSSPITIRLPDGREILTGRTADRSELDAMPAAGAIAETGAAGQPRVVQDNHAEIDIALARHNERVGETFLERVRPGRRGCAAAEGAGGAAGALALLGLAFALRRRR